VVLDSLCKCLLFLPFTPCLIPTVHSCEAFAHRGCKVYATSRNVDTIGDFQDTGIQKLALDVTSDDAVQRVVRDIMENEGRIDVVVNNAGLLGPGGLWQWTKVVKSYINQMCRSFD
jgi:NAD(P)-dependent dehydrogenase (short-subunit alcohol dehydrogenase family)